MKKHLAFALIGTALASWPVLAQQSNAPANTNPQANTRANQDRAMVLKQGEWRGSKLTGLTVYNNNDERIGDINELIIGKDGKIESIVLGVGGFLGLGEHDVAVPFGQVKFVEEPRRSDRTASRNETNSAAGARNDAAARMDTNANRTAANAPANNPPRAPETTGTTGTSSNVTRTTDNRDAYRGYPDHAVVNMSKDQLKALPEVRYSR
jgi:sporulation protein YlmC with PRC-barrel domain